MEGGGRHSWRHRTGWARNFERNCARNCARSGPNTRCCDCRLLATPCTRDQRGGGRGVRGGRRAKRQFGSGRTWEEDKEEKGKEKGEEKSKL